MLFNHRILFFSIFLIAFAPTAVHAHLVAAQFGNFYSGMLHPVTALEHIVPWLALAMLTGLQEKAHGRRILLFFPISVFLGTIAAWVFPRMESVSQLNLASFVILGALVALAWRLPLPAILVICMFFGLSHGYENGLALSESSISPLYIWGVTTAGYIVITLVSASSAAIAAERAWGQIAVRAAGSWITAVGIMMISLTYFRT